MNHHDPPLFHAPYGSQRGRFAIESLEMLDGKLGGKAEGLVLEWAELHQDDLRREWSLAQSRRPLFKIKPLE